MANINGGKYALTTLFPIRPGGHYAELKEYLRKMDRHPYGSPLSNVGRVHMARFAIVDDLVYQGVPAERDRLKSRYLLFMCDFDGETVEDLVGAMTMQIGSVVHDIWQHCLAYPGPGSRDRLIAYFEQCQVKTNLFFADRPKDEVATILRALMCKREFANFVATNQGLPRAGLRDRFLSMWHQLQSSATPHPGSM
jgi:hypothetical protein